MEMVVSRFEVYLIRLDPTFGHKTRKPRPCLIISPDEMNHHIETVIIAPMTTKGRNYPTRIPVTFSGKKGRIVLDQMRTVDKARLVKKLGKIEKTTQKRVLALLREVFEE
jgi:mRNA interferase MazF